jgi:predicted oxidoreductase
MVAATRIVVAGSGVAGLAAALEAVRAGATVTVVEARDAVGGASALSGGGCCIVGSPVQESRGIHDSVELALEDWRSAAQGMADLGWAERYLRDSRTQVWDWCEQLGLGWQDMVRKYPDNTVPRWHRPIGGGGAVVAALVRALAPYEVTWATGTRLTGLERAPSGAVRARIESSTGAEALEADAAVIATGGFANAPDLIDASLDPASPYTGAPYLTGGGPDATGDGLRVLAGVGARTANLGNVWFYPVGVPNHRYPGSRRGLVVRGIFSDVWVNSAGERFHDERDRGGRRAALAVAAQPGAVCWGITDADETDNLLLLDDDYFGTTEVTLPERRAEFLRACPAVTTAPTLQQLADRIGVPASPLRASVDRYNAEVAEGRISDFTPDGVRLRRIRRAPFTAIRYQLIAQKTFGGVVTDGECRVLGPGGDSLPGMFAAGEVAGMAGGRINGAGAIEGTMFGPCLYSGRIAGRAASRVRVSREEAACATAR